jgi:hypothetical protein
VSGRNVVSKLSLVLALTTLAVGGMDGFAHAATSSGWSIQPSPNPVGSTGTTLVSISCMGDGTCMAVGEYGTSGGSEALLAEYFDGTSWTVQTPPTPLGSTSLLTSVSCLPSHLCMAVGYTVSGSTVKPLVEESNTATWRIVSTPRPPNSFWAILSSVACTSADCIAVGGLIKNGVDSQEQPLSERWAGGAWSLLQTPNPHAENGSGLDALTCVAPDQCEAVGGYVFADTVENVFAFGWDGTTWTFQPQKNTNAGQLNADSGVSCMAATTCTSVGTWLDFQGRTRGLVEGWDGSVWTPQHIQNPPGFGAIALLGVSCAAPVCETVGDWSTSLNDFPSSTLAEQWDGSTWTIQSIPSPAGSTSSGLLAVSCTTSADCVAVGDATVGGVFQTLVETYSG